MSDDTYAPDALDVELIRELESDGRVSFRMIADRMGISDQTVRVRVMRLMESGLLRVAPLVNPFHFENSLLSLIGVRLEHRTQRETMDEISGIHGVVSVCNTAGEFDLMVEVFHGSRSELNEFLFEELPKVRGVKSTHSILFLDARNKWVPTENIAITHRE